MSRPPVRGRLPQLRRVQAADAQSSCARISMSCDGAGQACLNIGAGNPAAMRRAARHPEPTTRAGRFDRRALGPGDDIPWTVDRYPVSMRNIAPPVRDKAIEIANALLREGMSEGSAIRIAIARAKRWARTRRRFVADATDDEWTR
ncbi:hypothetical protein QZM22_04445 [Burkholderia oklahomensis]|uniref:hypothetical protein n=1 Tax=Burkholderia oklahomensis TaxID=342113 RepID=UPI002651650B|nr:hypothetical protein [Burkholderia oklahomensis]MDN7671791.1 hypothetical protein [Burkholderia oklahomensis]